MERSLAVTAKQLKKTFNGKEIIHECNMSVEQGTIYGFLGKDGIIDFRWASQWSLYIIGNWE